MAPPTSDTDSDSDDSILVKPTFSRKRLKKEAYEKKRVDQLFDDAVKSFQENNEQQRAIARLQLGEVNERSLIASAKALHKDSAEKIHSHGKRRKTENERTSALADATETQASSCPGSLSTILRGEVASLPSSYDQGVEYLEHVLWEGRNLLPGSMCSVLTSHIKQGTLNSYLLGAHLSRHVEADCVLPHSLLHWFIAVSSTSATEEQGQGSPTIDSLGRGACRTLSRLLREGKGYPQNGYLLSLSDLHEQLRDWFGLGGHQGCWSEAAKRTGVVSSFEDSFPPFTRFLHLWELALARKMVLVSTPDDMRHTSQIVVALLLASLDPLFDSSITYEHEGLPCLFRIISHVLEAAAMAFLGQEYESCLRSVSDSIVDTLLSGNDKASAGCGRWLSVSRVIRTVVGSSGASAKCKPLLLCHGISARALKASSEGYDARGEISAALQGWKVPDPLRESMLWQSIAISSVALNRSASALADEDGPICLAATEISHLCLIAALGQLESAGQIGKHDNPDKLLGAAYQDIHNRCCEIASKSQSLAMNNQYFLRANYYVSCMRQFPRLFIDKAASASLGDSQKTLDKWLHADDRT